MGRPGAAAGSTDGDHSMTFAVQGLPVARGIAIGRAVLMAGRVDVAHYFVDPSQIESEIGRVRDGRNAVIDEINRLQQTIAAMGPKEAPHELSALLDVHLMLLQDEDLITNVRGIGYRLSEQVD